MQVPELWKRERSLRLAGYLQENFLLLLLHLHHRDFGKSFAECRGAQLGAHATHYVITNHTLPAVIAFQTHLEGNVEEDGLHFIAIILCQLDPAMTLMRREIGCIHII